MRVDPAADTARLERVFGIAVATLTALGTLLLGMGERNVVLPVLAVIVAAGSVYLTDLRGWFWLNNTAANVAAVIALILAGGDLLRFDAERQLLAAANLLIYLQFVLLFRPKTYAVYWLLVVLSLTQVAVASAVNFELSFGILMIVYLFVALTVQLLFYRFREIRRHLDYEALQTVAAGGAPDDVAARLNPAGRMHWPLGRQTACFAPRGQSQLVGQVERTGVAAQAALLGGAALILTVGMFVLVPRLGDSQWERTSQYPTHLMGDDDTVTLGELGSIVSSGEDVMRVRFTDYSTGDAYLPVDEPMFRGLVLYTYETNKNNGQWQRSRYRRRRPSEWEATEAPLRPNLVRQEITVESLDTDVLYCIYPVVKSVPNDALRFDDRGRNVARDDSRQYTKFSFELLTTGLVDRRQYPFTPHHRDGPPSDQLALAVPNSLPGLRALAAETVASIDENNMVARARALERLLRDSGRFAYSLELRRSDMSLDPVEDFVVNTRTGHCEYFATALAMMLRSVGIKSRLVIGFKGGDLNRFGNFYQVKQLHAHAWVEAYVPRDRLPDQLPLPVSQWDGGGWLRLDPSPGGGVGMQTAESGFGWIAIRQFVEYVRYLWSNYVMGLDARRQQDLIYLPAWQAVKNAIAYLGDAQNRREIVEQVKSYLSAPRWGWYQGHWFDWRAGLVAVVGQLIIVFGVRAAWKFLARWLGWRTMRDPDGDIAGGTEVAFYRRLERLLATAHIHRAPSQTQREFALAAGGQLADLPHTRSLAGAPARIVDAFYRVRFGRLQVGPAEIAALQRSLDRLQDALDEADADRAITAVD